MIYKNNGFFIRIFLLILSILSGPVHAQKKTHYIFTGHSATHGLLRDKGISALSQTNFIHGFDITYAEDDSTVSDYLNVYFHKGKFDNNKQLLASPEIWKIQFKWFRYWRTNWFKKTKTDIGFHLQQGYTNQNREDFPNNSNYFSELISIGPAIQLKKYWYPPSGKKVELYCRGSFSVLNHIIRPSIASIFPINNTNKDQVDQETSFEQGKFTSVHHLQYANTSLGLNYFILKFIFVSADYSWEFIHYNQDNEYHEVNHQFFLRMGFYF